MKLGRVLGISRLVTAAPRARPAPGCSELPRKEGWRTPNTFVGGLQSNARRSSLGPRGMPRHLLGPSVAGSVGQLDAVAASWPPAMADGCVAGNVGQLPGKGGILMVHSSMLKPSTSIKILTFMLCGLG